jgi:hypothetical protein
MSEPLPVISGHRDAHPSWIRSWVRVTGDPVGVRVLLAAARPVAPAPLWSLSMCVGHACHWHPTGCRSAGVSGVLLAVPPGVRAGILLDEDPQPDGPPGLTGQLSTVLSETAAAATDPFLGISGGGAAAIRQPWVDAGRPRCG